MYNMYPPPMWGYPPSAPPQLTEDQFKKGMIFAAKYAAREEREKERKKNNDRRAKIEDQKNAEAKRRRVWLALEIYIIGIISQPFVVPLYNHLLAMAQKGQ